MMKKECNLGLMNMIIEQMCLAPNGQVEQYIKDKFIKFKNEQHTPCEKFDFINGLSKLDQYEISSFVKELISLDKHYLRPNE